MLDRVAKSVDPGQVLCSAVFDLGLDCLHRTVCPNTKGYYSKHLFG